MIIFLVTVDNKIVEYKYNLRYFSDGKNNIFIEFNIDDLIEYDNDLFQIVYLNDDYELKKLFLII